MGGLAQRVSVLARALPSLIFDRSCFNVNLHETETFSSSIKNTSYSYEMKALNVLVAQVH